MAMHRNIYTMNILIICIDAYNYIKKSILMNTIYSQVNLLRLH